MSGTVAILAHDTGRFSAFWEHALELVAHELPEGAGLMRLTGVDIAYLRNQVVNGDYGDPGDWVWFLDDDHTWPDMTILKHLLARDVDIVQPAVLRRQVPFLPVVGRVDASGRLESQTLEELGSGGIVEVDSLGMGCALIRKRVWETLDKPLFRVGEIYPDRQTEDVGFCRRARAAGFQCWVDLDHPVEHLLVASVRPKWTAQGWATALTVDGTEILAPATRKKKNIPAPAAEPVGTLSVSPPASRG